MVLIPREMLRWYGFDPSWDVGGCVIIFQKRLYGLDSSWEVGMILVPREKSCPDGLPRETSSYLELVILNTTSMLHNEWNIIMAFMFLEIGLAKMWSGGSSVDQLIHFHFLARIASSQFCSVSCYLPSKNPPTQPGDIYLACKEGRIWWRNLHGVTLRFLSLGTTFKGGD